MNNGADAADQVVSMSLKGIEVLAKITGAGAKNLATYLYAVLRDQKKTKGKTRLEGLLRSGKELKIFAVRNRDLKRFTQEARRYGVLYCALHNRKSGDGICDIMVRVEDAAKIDRIVERFKLASVDTMSIKTEIEKTKASVSDEKGPAEKGTPAEKSADVFLDELFSKPSSEPTAERTDSINPTTAPTEKPRPSEPISAPSEKSEGDTNDTKRISIRQKLRDIVASRQKEQPKHATRSKDRSESATKSEKPKRKPVTKGKHIKKKVR